MKICDLFEEHCHTFGFPGSYFRLRKQEDYKMDLRMKQIVERNLLYLRSPASFTFGRNSEVYVCVYSFFLKYADPEKTNLLESEKFV